MNELPDNILQRIGNTSLLPLRHSTGVSLSLVCAVKGYPLYIVSSDAFAQEKLVHMKILGAQLQILHSESGGMTEKLTRDLIEAAGLVAVETGASGPTR
jgi:cysteine synthase A